MSKVADCVTLGDHFAHLVYFGACGCGRGADLKPDTSGKSTYDPDPKPEKKPKKGKK